MSSHCLWFFGKMVAVLLQESLQSIRGLQLQSRTIAPAPWSAMASISYSMVMVIIMIGIVIIMLGVMIGSLHSWNILELAFRFVGFSGSSAPGRSQSLGSLLFEAKPAACTGRVSEHKPRSWLQTKGSPVPWLQHELSVVQAFQGYEPCCCKGLGTHRLDGVRTAAAKGLSQCNLQCW